MKGSSVGTDLCKSCGLCCTGVLFDFVRIEAEEVGPLERLGFELDRDVEDRTRFALPCPMFDTCCSIYQDRPSKCRQFQCELLKKVENEEVPFEDALGRVAEAKTMVARIWPLLENATHGAAGKQWNTLLKAWKAKSPPERSQASDSELVLNLTVLNRFLDRHFRSEKKRQVSELRVER